jgi:4'-phosphopantetheinyl transferase
MRASSDEVHIWPLDLGPQGGRGPLLDILARYLERDPARIELRRGEHGKPALAGDPQGLRFNLSHSGPLALVAVTKGREVGIDVERHRRRSNLQRLAERALDRDSAAAVAAAAPDARLRVFYEAWTRREAIAKCTGVGLRGPPADTPVTVWGLPADEGWTASLAVAGRDRLPVRWMP